MLGGSIADLVLSAMRNLIVPLRDKVSKMKDRWRTEMVSAVVIELRLFGASLRDFVLAVDAIDRTVVGVQDGK